MQTCEKDRRLSIQPQKESKVIVCVHLGLAVSIHHGHKALLADSLKSEIYFYPQETIWSGSEKYTYVYDLNCKLRNFITIGK